MALGSECREMRTLAPGDVPVKPGGTHCWLLDRGRQVPLKVGLNSIGRLPDNDVVIDDATVSRRHCAIVVHSDLTIEIHDVASKNGTTVNGHKILGPTRLRDNDEIGLSDHKLTFLLFSGQPTNLPSHHSSVDDRTLAGCTDTLSQFSLRLCLRPVRSVIVTNSLTFAHGRLAK